MSSALIALAALVLVTAGPGYAEPLGSTSIPSSLADDEKRLLPEVMSEFYGSFDKAKACWMSKHEDDTYSRGMIAPPLMTKPAAAEMLRFIGPYAERGVSSDHDE